MDTLDLSIGNVTRGKDALLIVVPANASGALQSAVRSGALTEALAKRANAGGRVKLGGNLYLAAPEVGGRTIVVQEVPAADAAGPIVPGGMPNGNRAGLGLLSALVAQVPLTERYRQAGAEAYGLLRNQSLEAASIVIVSPEGVGPVGGFVEGLSLGGYAFDQYQGKKATAKRKITLASPVPTKELEVEVRRALTVSESAMYARDLTNTPAEDLGPEDIEKAAFALGKTYKLKVTSLRVPELKRKGMGALLGVGQGSEREPRLVILEHRPKGATRTICFIGKGVTFDSGGLSLKTAAGMELMKKDMAGAGVVLGAMRAAGTLKTPVNVIALIPTAENMPDARALRPGDVVTSASGKTIEVINTDAEGRLILADALTHAKTFSPEVIIDLATLTGEAGRTFANVLSPVLGNDWNWIEALVEAGRAVHERLWPLPILDEYRKAMNGDIADLKNSSNLAGYSAGSILGASFLSEFAGTTPWVHLDIANTSWVGSDSGYFKKGATGMGVRLISKLLEMVAARGEAGAAKGRGKRASA